MPEFEIEFRGIGENDAKLLLRLNAENRFLNTVVEMDNELLSHILKKDIGMKTIYLIDLNDTQPYVKSSEYSGLYCVEERVDCSDDITVFKGMLYSHIDNNAVAVDYICMLIFKNEEQKFSQILYAERYDGAENVIEEARLMFNIKGKLDEQDYLPTSCWDIREV